MNSTPIKKDVLKVEFDKKFKPTKDNKTVKFKYINDFLDDFIAKSSTLINRNTKRKYTKQMIKSYKQSCKRLKQFQSHYKLKIPIDGFTLPIYDMFIKHLTDDCEYSINYVGTIIKNIKVFLKKAEEFGYSVHQDFKKSDFAVIKEESEAIVLDEQEIDCIFNYDFSNNDRLQNCRDLAIIGLWTGLRVSDFLTLKKINVEDKFIAVQPQKTKNTSGTKVIIPLHHQIKEIIAKRGMPRMISSVKYNLYIKEICKIVGIDKIVKGALSIKNQTTGKYRKKVGMHPKYKLVSSHTCRRSFATNVYKMNFPTLSIMKITGHTSEKSFLTYIKVTPSEHAEKLLKHWEEYYNK